MERAKTEVQEKEVVPTSVYLFGAGVCLVLLLILVGMIIATF